jgi:hypothetical protein
VSAWTMGSSSALTSVCSMCVISWKSGPVGRSRSRRRTIPQRQRSKTRFTGFKFVNAGRQRCESERPDFAGHRSFALVRMFSRKSNQNPRKDGTRGIRS